jgi:hypothetical protein
LTEIISKGSFVDYLYIIDYLSPTSGIAGEGQEKSTSISKSSPSLLGEGVGGMRLKTNMRSSA